MRTIFFALLCIILSGTAQAFTVHDNTVIEISLNEYELQTWIGKPVDNVIDQTRKMGASVGMNASFFCPAESAYRYCGADGSTTSDRVVAGEVYSKYRDDTGERGILWVDENNKALFVQNNKWQWYMGNSNSGRIDDIYYGISNFPILLDKGIDRTEESPNLISKQMNTASRKAFICTNETGDTIYMWFVKIGSIYEMPEYIKERYGCYYAINLDAGASSALVVNDQHRVWPGRKVADGFVAVPKPEFINPQVEQYKLSIKEKIALKAISNLFVEEFMIKGTQHKDETIQKLKLIEWSKRLYPLVPQRAFVRALTKELEPLIIKDEAYGFSSTAAN